MSRKDVINHLKITYNRLTYEERLEIRTWINGQYDFSEKDTSEEDPKINIKWRGGNHDKKRFLVNKEEEKRLPRRGKDIKIVGPEGVTGKIWSYGIVGVLGVHGKEGA